MLLLGFLLVPIIRCVYVPDDKICSQLRSTIPNHLHPPHADHRRLLLISVDGFRYDLLNETTMPILHRWVKSGTHFANGVLSQVPADTGPNHESIATGLTAESHGIVANMFYDRATGEKFDLFNHSKMPNGVANSKDQKWYSATPIWEANRLAGGSSAIVKWPLRNEKGENKEGTYFKEFQSRVRSVDDLFEKVLDIERAIDCGANFAVWYIEEPDSIQHEFGQFFGGNLIKMLSELDELFRRFIERMEKRGFLSTTDVIIVADHGHNEIKNLDSVLCIDQEVTGITGVDYNVSDTSIFTQSEAHAAEIFTNLTKAIAMRQLGIKIVRKSEMPPWWHYNHPSRVEEIVHEPALGFEVRARCMGKWLNRETFHVSTHGSDPRSPEMRGLLAMIGPSFKRNFEINDIPQNIDLFPLISRILGISEIPPNEGRISRVIEAIVTGTTVPRPMRSSSSQQMIFATSILLVISLL